MKKLYVIQEAYKQEYAICVHQIGVCETKEDAKDLVRFFEKSREDKESIFTISAMDHYEHPYVECLTMNLK